MTTPLPSSSWLASMAYKRTPDGTSYLAFFLKPYCRLNGIWSEPTALLYGGPITPLPSWVPGLVAAGRVKTAEGKIGSPGAVFHRLVREKYQGQIVKGEDKVKELREMMK